MGLFALRLFTPPVAGIITNDSVGYLGRSFHPFSFGFVVQGYRQAAYPLWLQALSWLHLPLGFDTVFAAALAQRVMLLVGVILVWGALRWWAVPLLLVVTSATYVIHTDYVLVEGFLVPAALILGGLSASLTTRVGVGARYPRMTLVAVTGLSVAMGAMKLQYSISLLLACAVAWLGFRDRTVTVKFALVTLAAGGLLVTGLTVAQTVENHSELGHWEPVGERARAEWYGAWEAVFELSPENRTKPELAEFYDDGDLYVFLHGIEQSEPDYGVRQAAIRERVAEMFSAAGTSKRQQQAAAFLGALKGGRTDEIAQVTELVWQGGPDAFRDRIRALNRRPGPAETFTKATHGEPTGLLTIDSATGRLQDAVGDYRPARPWLGLGALFLGLLGCAVRGRHRPFILASTLSLVGVCAVLASAYIDNARYLVGPMTISLLGATLGARALTLAYLGDRSSGDE